MKIFCGPRSRRASAADLRIVLFDRAHNKSEGAIGALVAGELTRAGLQPTQAAWDFLSFALSILAADLAGHRSYSS